MPIHFPFGNGLLRAAVSLGFLGCLVAQETLYSHAATSEHLIVTSEAIADAYGATSSFCGSQSANLDNASVLPARAVLAGSTYQGDTSCFSYSDFMLTAQVEIGLPGEFGVAFEDDDSIEMLRVDIQQRTFGGDRALIGPKVVSQGAGNTRRNISPPLLV
jgi:hypothetical protein